MLSFSERQQEELQAELLRSLRCVADPDTLQQALIAEHIRAAIYTGSARGDEMAALHRVHTTRLMTNLRRNLECLWPGLERDQRSEADEVGRLTLNNIERLSDISHIGGGFWISNPLRFVEAHNAEFLLVLGGVPREVVQLATGADPISAAATRFVHRNDLAANAHNADLMQSVDIWLGTTEPLSTWTKATLAAHMQRMSLPQDISVDQVEIYAPELFRDQHRLGRWMPAGQVARPILGPRLFRPLASYAREYARPHYLGIFGIKTGTIFLRQSAPVEFEVSRRLRFGFDDVLKCSRTVSLSIGEHICALDLRFALPEPEGRVLALGWQSRPARAETEHRWMFQSAALPIIRHALGRLLISPTVMDRRH
jgi:hypothetical protein